MFVTSLLLTGALLGAPAEPETPPAKPSVPPAPDVDPPAGQESDPAVKLPFAASSANKTAVTTQACDGSRVSKPAPPQPRCAAWHLEWTHKGKVWAALSAPTAEALEAKRARHLGFARQYARAFDKALDPRYAEASDPICDQCDPGDARGRWGEGQTFSGLETARAVSSAREGLTNFETVFFEVHAPDVAEVARLAADRKTSAAAKRYAKQLELASADLVAWEAQLDHAELVRSESKVRKVAAAMRARGAALDKGRAALSKLVATAVSKAHAGNYNEEGGTGTPKPQLEIAFDGAAVTGTYRIGEATSVWFEGQVGLDGSVHGRSLMAPAGKTLTCAEHTEACGYAYIPALIRFSVRPEPKQEVLELWFQKTKWVRANPFSRAG